jgi:7,8-dihydroneopterin aldolase/epimerase/oxygenase
MAVDRIFLRGLKIEAVIGIWAWERRIRQTVHLDLEMATDARRAASTDAIDSALNYKNIAKRVIAFVDESRFQLVESLAEGVAQLIVREFDVPWVRVSVAKPGAIEGSREVGIEIERTSSDYE